MINGDYYTPAGIQLAVTNAIARSRASRNLAEIGLPGASGGVKAGSPRPAGIADEALQGDGGALAQQSGASVGSL